ncbi:hypothetical protein H8356DRAFT_1637305 [Neocallimastix lanati (nom. inval.)]|uniref:MARVEL domain-containing protein n=1 Tax=Neocallimastix californiae TaxID=1754190 RepID=A0A1Y2FB47_9FUNG|nr:hypothetical protein H8356DRAFT_1637305 [Neocallimastix sp. JGI-2020a]ORY80085.1 hypothetical protein LY90DRAFT_38831 [Neocallimastix californiae]|eukprot:ORY80085.1 hypothetical protein LY90DRAFT_38831 [Neocallimastix californiae]
MEIINSIIHPQKFLGLTDLRIGTMILAFVNFVFILVNFSSPGSWKWIITLVITILSLICTGFGCWGAYKNSLQHVTWYFYYTFVNLIFSIYYCISYILSLSIFNFIVSLIYLVVAIYTLCVVKGYTDNISSGDTTVV